MKQSIKTWLESMEIVSSVKWLRRASVVGFIAALLNVAAPIASLGGDEFIPTGWLVFCLFDGLILAIFAVGAWKQSRTSCSGLLIYYVFVKSIMIMLGFGNSNPGAIIFSFICAYVFLMGCRGSISFYKLTHPQYPE